MTSTQTRREPSQTSSCVSWERPRPTASRDDVEDDADDGDDDGEWRGPNRDPDRETGWGEGWWRQNGRRSIQRRQNDGICIEWSAGDATRTIREVATTTRRDRVVKSEIWTITPNCPSAVASISSTGPAVASSAAVSSIAVATVSSAAASTNRNDQPVETAFVQGGAASASNSPTLITTTGRSTSPDQAGEASFLSAIETASELGNLENANTQALSQSSARPSATTTLSAEDTISTDLVLAPSPDTTHRDGTAAATAASSSKSPNEVAGIAAGVIGAIAALLLLVGACFWWRRKQRDKETTLIFAPGMRSPTVADKEDYPQSITSVSEVSERPTRKQIHLTDGFHIPEASPRIQIQLRKFPSVAGRIDAPLRAEMDGVVVQTNVRFRLRLRRSANDVPNSASTSSTPSIPDYRDKYWTR